MKSLRMTIKAHLKTELKRRTAQANAESATPAVAAPTPTPAPAETPAAVEETPAPANGHQSETPAKIASEATVEAANNESAVAPSIEQGDAEQGEPLAADVSS